MLDLTIMSIIYTTQLELAFRKVSAEVFFFYGISAC